MMHIRIKWTSKQTNRPTKQTRRNKRKKQAVGWMDGWMGRKAARNRIKKNSYMFSIFVPSQLRPRPCPDSSPAYHKLSLGLRDKPIRPNLTQQHNKLSHMPRTPILVPCKKKENNKHRATRKKKTENEGEKIRKKRKKEKEKPMN